MFNSSKPYHQLCTTLYTRTTAGWFQSEAAAGSSALSNIVASILASALRNFAFITKWIYNLNFNVPIMKSNSVVAFTEVVVYRIFCFCKLSGTYGDSINFRTRWKTWLRTGARGLAARSQQRFAAGAAAAGGAGSGRTGATGRRRRAASTSSIAYK